jgi:hypothetical protein
MPKFKITIESTAFTDYIVEADDYDDAEEKLDLGNGVDGEDVKEIGPSASSWGWEGRAEAVSNMQLCPCEGHGIDEKTECQKTNKEGA